MPTLILDPAPPQLEDLVERRRRLDLDRADEVWDGVLHMNPAPHRRHARLLQQLAELLGPAAAVADLLALFSNLNIGGPEDYRVPDGALFGPGPDEVYCPTAALVVEIISPGDESWAKLPFYAGHDVDEVLIVDPEARAVHWLALSDGQYVPVARSGLVALGPEQLVEQIRWS